MEKKNRDPLKTRRAFPGHFEKIVYFIDLSMADGEEGVLRCLSNNYNRDPGFYEAPQSNIRVV
jgi:Asp-tRNA(Asn)/Glu-tRNA(Gln) amidotransferase B subunit